MAPTKKMNADYCREYRRKHVSKYKAKDKERKQIERDCRKCLGTKVNNMKFKENDHMRKSIAKEAAVVRPCASSAEEMQSSSSSFKDPCTKFRSLRKAENSLPKSPHKKKGIIDSFSKKFNLRIAMAKSKKLGHPLNQLNKVK